MKKGLNHKHTLSRKLTKKFTKLNSNKKLLKSSNSSFDIDLINYSTIGVNATSVKIEQDPMSATLS